MSATFKTAFAAAEADNSSRPCFLLLQQIMLWQDECGTPEWDEGRELYARGGDLLEDDADRLRERSPTTEKDARTWLTSVYNHCLRRGKRRPADFDHATARELFARLLALLQKEEEIDGDQQ